MNKAHHQNEEQKMEKFSKLLDDSDEEDLRMCHSLNQNNFIPHEAELPRAHSINQQEEEKKERLFKQDQKQQQQKQREKEEKRRKFQEYQAELIRIKKEEEQRLSLLCIQRLAQENDLMAKEQKYWQEKAVNELQCSICLTHLPPSQYDPLDKCPHMFHKQCIMPYLQVQIQSRQIPIKCPESECEVELTDMDIRDHTTPQIYEKYKSYTLDVFIQRNPHQVSCCPTPDCKYVFAPDQGNTHFICPNCLKSYCLDCKTEWHEGLTCEDYRLSKEYNNEEDRKFVKYVRGSNFKQCPRCKYWVERSQGCDHMRCRCGQEFCYKCGGKYRLCKCRGYDLDEFY